MIALNSNHCEEAGILARGIARRFMALGDRDPGYQTDLCLQGLLCLYDATGDANLYDYVEATIQHRGERPCHSLNWRIVFTDLHSELWLRTRDDRYMEGWLEDLQDYRCQLPLDEEGRIQFFIEPEHQRLLIDMLQGFSLRMARAGLFTGDATYFDLAAKQYLLYAKTLVNPQSGLWHHGRGWNPERRDALSPAGWCRGQAWVVRGLVETMRCMPETSSAFQALHRLLGELTDALLCHQTEGGMWHQLMDQPQSSYPETSGTGMIVYYLGLAWQSGWLNNPVLHTGLCRAQNALRQFVDDKFQVHNGCPHSPPQPDRAGYVAIPPAIDDRHAIGAMMMALSLPRLHGAPMAAAPVPTGPYGSRLTPNR